MRHPPASVIYLDHNATTPVLPEVREAMLPYLDDDWGNPSSTYRFGSKLKSVIESAREQVAELVGAASPREILFTGSGTESKKPLSMPPCSRSRGNGTSSPLWSSILPCSLTADILKRITAAA